MNTSGNSDFRSSPRSTVMGTESLDKFTQMVKNASILANQLSSNELLTAFQISFNLIEKISDIMLNTCSENKNYQNDNLDAEESWKYNGFPISPSSFNPENRVRSNLIEKMGDTMDHNDKQLKVLTDETSNYHDKSTGTIDKSMFDKTFSDKHDSNDELLISPNMTNTPRSPSPPNTNGSSINDTMEHGQKDEILDSDDIPNSSDIGTSSGDSIQVDDNDSSGCSHKTDSDCHKAMSDRRPSKSVLPNPESTQEPNSVEVKDVQMGFRLQNDLRRWRLTNTDKLNTLIDECERQLNGRKLYVCKFCGKVYEIKSSMRYHMKIIHLQMHLRTTEMQCRICGKQFTCVSAVNRHQSKCMLSNFAESRFRKSKISSQFPGSSPTLDSDGGHQLSTSFNIHTSTPNCLGSIGPNSSLLSDSNPIMTENFANSSVGTQKSNLHSAFRVPDSVHRSLPNPFAVSSNLEAIKMISPNPALNFNGNTEESNYLPYQLPSTCDMKSCLIPAPNSVDSLDSSWSAAAMWSNLPSLGCNFSDLTPAQINMCMKAVVQGIRSTVERSGNSETSSLNPGIETDQSRSDESSWPSTTGFRIPSDSSDSDQNRTVETGDMAIDLSSRPRSASMMIESF